MSFHDLVIVGVAGDGPDGEILDFSSLDEIYDTFGRRFKEYILVGPSATGVTLSYPAVDGSLKVYGLNRWGRVINQPLYSLSLSGNSVSFGSIGASAVLQFEYLIDEPYSSINIAAEALSSDSGIVPSVYRLNGSPAYVDLGSIKLRSQYSGSRYNNIRVDVLDNTLSIWWPFNFDINNTFNYSISEGVEALAGSIMGDFLRGSHPLIPEVINLNNTISTGTFYSSGGLDGNLDVNSIAAFLDSLEPSEVGMVLLVGDPDESIVSSIYTEVRQPATLSTIAWKDQGPTCFITGLPASYYLAPSGSIQSYLSGLNYLDDRIYYVPGWATIELRDSGWKTVPGTYLFSSQLLSSPDCATNRPLKIANYYPIWPSTWSSNYILVRDFIRSGLAFWNSNPTDGSDSLLNKIKIEIAKLVTDTVESFIGDNEVELSQLQSELATGIRNITNISQSDVDVYRFRNFIVVQIYFKPYGETRVFSFAVSFNVGG